MADIHWTKDLRRDGVTQCGIPNWAVLDRGGVIRTKKLGRVTCLGCCRLLIAEEEA